MMRPPRPKTSGTANVGTANVGTANVGTANVGAAHALARPGRRLPIVLAVGALVVAGAGAGLAAILARAPGPHPSRAAASATYRYYRTVIDRDGLGPMMGGNGWPMGPEGYTWMLGGARAPGWMRGEALPGSVAGEETDPGTVMGRLFADAPGPRVAPSMGRALGDAVPRDAAVDRAANRITFETTSVHLVVLASPSMPAEGFVVDGMTDPTIVVPNGAAVSIDLVNADDDMAHGLVVTAAGAGASWAPMMVAPPAFRGAATWFLGEATAAGMHEGTLEFTASTPGTYEYLCPVPGHAEEGMAGTFVVTGTTTGTTTSRVTGTTTGTTTSRTTGTATGNKSGS